MGAIVLFDGVCNFCESSVNFIIRRDRRSYFKFAPLQSDEGRRLSNEFGLRTAAGNDNTVVSDQIDSIILVEDGKAYTHSTAGLRIARHLDGPWSILYGFIIVPRVIRDYFYRLLARHRYRFFGRKNECMIPTPEIRQRFLA